MNIIRVVLITSIVMFIVNTILIQFFKNSNYTSKLHIIDFLYSNRLLFLFIMISLTFITIMILHAKCLIVIFVFAIIIALRGIYIFVDSFRTDDITYMYKLMNIDKFLSLGLFILAAILAVIILIMK